MGALRQPRPTETIKKPPVSESTGPKLDRYGRDPDSLPERLRARTDYEKGTGWAPFYHGALADLPRLSSGAVCYAFTLVVNMLSLGRPTGRDEGRNAFTEPISTEDLAVLCRANVRDIQRQLAEMKERGMIAVKVVKNGTTRYAISLLFPKWQGLDDYAVWKRKQVVAIDESPDDAEGEDEAPAEISKDAVKLTRKPQAVRPGRASKAVKVGVGVRELTFQNDSTTVDAAFQAVVTSGRLVVSATFKTGETEAKGEDKGNAGRHPCRELPANEGSSKKRNKGESHPRSSEVANLFDPLLQKSGSRLLSPDEVALREACAELGAMSHDALVYFVLGPKGRGARPISSPKAVASIIREARTNWEKTQRSVDEVKSCACGKPGGYRASAMCMECWEKA